MRANAFQVFIFVAAVIVLTAVWIIDGLIVEEIHRTETKTEAIKATVRVVP